MLNSNLKQKELIIESEKPHELGLRHRGISGNICNLLIRDFLRTEFPHYKIDVGVVSKENSREWASSPAFSPQIDILIYTNEPLVRLYDYVVVPKSKLICGIEIKKWLSISNVKNVNSAVNKQIKKIKDFTEKATYLVSFRISSNVDDIKTKSIADDTFLFSYGCKGYPDYYEKIDEIIIKGELGRLVDTISQLICTR